MNFIPFLEVNKDTSINLREIQALGEKREQTEGGLLGKYLNLLQNGLSPEFF